MRILSIDDERNFLDMLKQYFDPRGYEIDVTTDGSDGLELLRKGKYDVVLIDLKMAGIGGEEVMDKIVEMGLNVKAIFITAYDDIGKTKEKLIKQGVYAFLEKPLTSLKELEKLINSACGR
jgi:DNA-binding NtrC family response regulator